MQTLFLGRPKKASFMGAFFMSALLMLNSAHAESCRMPSGLREVQVERVVDGDTLRLTDGRSVRMIGLNTPEKARAGKPAEPFALDAMRNLERLVDATNQRIYLQTGTEASDRYGRVLAHVFSRDGRSLEDAQLAAGMGMSVAIAPNTARLGCQLEAENQARRASRGVWQQRRPQDVRTLEKGGFALLRGRVQSSERSRGGWRLVLENHLIVNIDGGRLDTADERYVQSLTGRTVEVRGWVTDRRRAAGDTGSIRWQLKVADSALVQTL